MCNEVARRIALGQLREDWSELKVPLVFPKGLPNLGRQDSIRITDSALILRAHPEGVSGTTRRWSWPGQRGRPVYNYRAEGRAFPNECRSGRCLIPVDAFYEFTDPPAGSPPITKARAKKAKWRFAAAFGGPLAIGDEPWFCIAGFWRTDPALSEGTAAEAFTLLTAAPSPDVAPHHHRQVVLPPHAAWVGWLDGSLAAADLLVPPPAGCLHVTRV